MTDFSKIRSATVRFCDGLTVEGYELPDGNCWVSIGLVSEALGYSRSWLGRVISKKANVLVSLQDFGFSGITLEINVRTAGGQQTIKGISESDFRAIVEHEASHGSESALQLKGIKTQKRLQSRTKLEKIAQDRLAQQLNGKTEVSCLAGRIDIVTSSEVIEVKHVRNWKSALGQILVYGDYYPSHQKRIHLIGETQASFLSMVQGHSAKLGVSVTWSQQ